MDLAIPIFLFLLSFIFLLLGLFEEREENFDSKEEEERSIHLVIIFFILATAFFFMAGITMMYVTESYYSAETDQIEETIISSYRPIGWFGIGFGAFCALLTSIKVFDYLGIQWEGE